MRHGPDARRRWLGATLALAAAPVVPCRVAAQTTLSSAADIERAGFRASDGVGLSYLLAGRQHAGPVIVFVPGWSMPAEIFRAQLETLGRNHRVVAFDPRGQGESDVAPDGYTLEQRTSDLAALLALHANVVLVGWSLGALEVLEYVATRGESRLAGVMLVDNSVGEPPAPRGGDFIARLRADRARTLDGFVRSMFRSPQPDTRIARLTQQALRLPLDASVALLTYPRPREHWRNVTRGIAVPLAYVVTPRFAAQASSLHRHRPGTRVEVFERAGHALFVDEADRFNELVHEFVASLPRPLR